MVVDTSALVAISRGEPEMEQLLAAIDRARSVFISAPTRLEACIVCHRRFGPLAAQQMETLIQGLEIVTIPFDEGQLLIAMEAYRTYGRGRSPADLNFGDCFSYALAKSRNLPLLFKGDDFRLTDVEPAL